MAVKEDQISMLGLHEEDMNRFGKILQKMNLEKVPEFASTVRQYGYRSTGNSPTQGLSEPCFISCKVISPPLCGSFHIVFPIQFADGVNWMLKISANGDHFDTLAAAALASEARTMQMLRKETSIPVPAVYAFDASSNNMLSSPFILMEKLGGRPLCYRWFDNQVPKARLEHFRVKTLKSLAALMVQLNKFTINTGGSLVFGSDGTPVGLGGAKVMDGVAVFNKFRPSETDRQDCNEGGDSSSPGTRGKVTKSNTQQPSRGSQPETDKGADDDIICERGPFTCPKAYFMSNLNRPDPAFRADAYERGTDMCLRLFIEWALADSRNEERRFVLTHPDFDVQNILIAEDGTITGLIDWDGVAAVPREVGCAQYPLWLMRDWAPLRYKYDTEKREVFEDAGYEESSPAELASYRALYAHFIEVEIGKMAGGPNAITTFGTLPKYEAELTRRSLVMRSLDLSAGDPYAALQNVNHIIDQIEELTAPEWEDTDSDLDSIASWSSFSDSDSTIDSDNDEEVEEHEASKLNGQGLGCFQDDVSTQQADQEVKGVDHSVPEANLNVKHSSWGIAGENIVSSASLAACQKSVEEPKAQDPPKIILQDNTSTPPAPLGWKRRLLRFGCNTAERSLRGIAKIGYVLIDAVVEAAEILAEVEVQHAKAFANLDQVKDSDTLQQIIAVRFSENIEAEQFEDTASTQEVSESEQPNDALLVQTNTVGPEVPSTQSIVTAEQIEGTNSIPPTVEPQDIPLRKAELLQAARMKEIAAEKANYRAGKAAIKQELKVWERIALAVWCRGITLEQLQMSETKISRWVSNTLKAERDQGNFLAADAHPTSAAGTVSAAAEMVDSGAAAPTLFEDYSVHSEEKRVKGQLKEGVLQTANGGSKEMKKLAAIQEDNLAPALGNKKPSTSGSSSSTTSPNNNISLTKLDISEGNGMAGWKSTMFDEEAARNLANVIEVELLLGISSAFGDRAQSDVFEPAYSLRGFSKSRTSYFTQIFCSRSQSKKDKGCLSPDSSAKGDNSDEEDGSDVEDARSSATSLSDGEAEHTENEKSEEDKDDASNVAAFAAGEDDDSQDVGDEDNGEPVEDNREEAGMAAVLGRADQTAFTPGSFEAEEPIHPHASRRVYDTRSGEWVEATKSDETIKPGSAATTTDDAEVEKKSDAGIGNGGGDENTEDACDHRAGQGEGEGEESSWDGIIPEFEDHGEFDHYTVCNLLGIGQLDELRLLRLKEGFLMLLEQY